MAPAMDAGQPPDGAVGRFDYTRGHGGPVSWQPGTHATWTVEVCNDPACAEHPFLIGPLAPPGVQLAAESAITVTLG